MAVRTDKCIFYHIPKTGGMWVKEAMRRAGLEHTRCRGEGVHEFDLRRDHATPALVPDWNKRGLFSFCFVRHPVAWYRSFWCYRLKTGKFNKRFPPDRAWDDDFESFVVNMLEAFPGGFVGRLYHYYVNDVDYVGRQEGLAHGLVEALTLAGETFDEEALRATEPQNLSARDPKYGLRCSFGSPELLGRLKETERWVLETFYSL